MLQEDSNGEASFEIIDKNIADKQVPPTSAPSNTSSGNLLSNVPPPSALPSFIPTSLSSLSVTSPLTSASSPSNSEDQEGQKNFQPQILSDQSTTKTSGSTFYRTEFSAAIPPNKGIQHGIDPESSRQSSASNVSASEQYSTTKVPPKAEESGGLFEWVKGAVSSGGIFSKVAEKAKSSVDSMITTLDPQMKEYIYSGGDTDVLVASTQEDKVSAVREAFQSVFGKATVEGISVRVSNIAAQPVGFQAGLNGAEERIQAIFKDPKMQPVPVVAVEGFLAKLEDDRWYELAVVLIKDPVRQLSLHTYTQMTPVPSEIVALAEEDTPKDYPLKSSGFSVTIGSLMAANLGVSHNQWHHSLTGIYRREMILMASKALASLYKNCIRN